MRRARRRGRGHGADSPGLPDQYEGPESSAGAAVEEAHAPSESQQRRQIMKDGRAGTIL